jgi:hypothetical protein
MKDNKTYDKKKLLEIKTNAIKYFKEILKNKDLNGLKIMLPNPKDFEYFNEFKEYDGVKGGILIVGLNPHKVEDMNKLIKKYSIEKDRNTSDKLLKEYPYFSLFTTKEHSKSKEKPYSMNLLEVEPNIKFADVILIRTASKVKLKNELEEDVTLEDLIEQGWDKYLKPVIELIKPDVIVSNSKDLSSFLERYKYKCPNNNSPLEGVISIDFNNECIPVVLSGQVTGQRAIDKWNRERMKKAIINSNSTLRKRYEKKENKVRVQQE